MCDVAFSCDDNGAKFLRVTVGSLLSHYRGAEPLRINVFEGFGGHSAAHKAELQAIIDRFNVDHHSPPPPSASTFFTLRYINIEPFISPYADLILNREKSRWNVFTWTPIFTPLVLDDATGNVAHFDIDMLFNDDVSKILDLDLGDDLIAAVAEYGRGDPIITEAVWGKGILPVEADRYFNTGTIVFNTAKCREERTWEKILDWYRAHYEIADRIEQDAWNALYWKRTRLLPLRWNFHDRLIKGYPKRNLADRYWQGNPPAECLEAALNPAILHFWGPKKPWKPCHRPYRRLYHEAMCAVSEVPPSEPLTNVWHDWKNRRDLEAVRKMNGFLEDMKDPARARMRIEEAECCRHHRKVLKAAFLRPLEWLGILVLLAVLVPLPHRCLLTVCDLVAGLYYLFDGKGRRLAQENLALVLGTRSCSERSRRLILRRSYRTMTRSVGHAFWTCFRARARAAAVSQISASTRAFLQAHRPAVTVSGHIGCWEILSQIAFLEGHAMMSVAKDIGTPGMTRLLMRARRSIGQEIVPADGAFKALMTGIRSGKSLGLLVDQCVCPVDGGVWVRFLGRPMPVSAAPAFFAAKAKVPIVVAWSRPLKDGYSRCEMVDEISAEAARDVWATTQRCAHDLERVIRRHPSCWVMNYDFFRYNINEQDAKALAVREGEMTR